MPDVSPDPVQSRRISGKVEIAPGVTIFESAELSIADYRGFDVEARVAYNGRRLEVQRLTVSKRPDGAPVNGEALRTIAVDELLREALRHAIARSVTAFAPGRVAPGVTRVAAGRYAGPEADLARSRAADEAERLRGLGPVRETLESVAAVYRLAEVIGEPPTKAVREAFDISQSTAGAWIGRARAAELLPPVDQLDQPLPKAMGKRAEELYRRRDALEAAARRGRTRT